MKRILIGIIGALAVLLASCSKGNSIESTSTPSIEVTPTVEGPSFDELWANASKENEFSIHGIKCKLLSAGTNMSYIGTDFNNKTLGVRIYIEYSPGLLISQDEFVAIDKNLTEFTPIVADGLDFLGKNRGELGEDLDGNPKCGYIRMALPENQTEFVLRFNDSNNIKYIRFTVSEEWE